MSLAIPAIQPRICLTIGLFSCVAGGGWKLHGDLDPFRAVVASLDSVSDIDLKSK